MGEFLTYDEWLKDYGYEKNDVSYKVYEEWVDSYYALLAMKG